MNPPTRAFNLLIFGASGGAAFIAIVADVKDTPAVVALTVMVPGIELFTSNETVPSIPVVTVSPAVPLDVAVAGSSLMTTVPLVSFALTATGVLTIGSPFTSLSVNVTTAGVPTIVGALLVTRELFEALTFGGQSPFMNAAP